MVTLAPRLASSRAIAEPIPREEPVTMATFPARDRGDVILSMSWRYWYCGSDETGC